MAKHQTITIPLADLRDLVKWAYGWHHYEGGVHPDDLRRATSSCPQVLDDVIEAVRRNEARDFPADYEEI